MRSSLSVLAAAAALLIGCTVPTHQSGSGEDPWLRPPAVPHPADNEPNEARVELGKMLFFDPRLSGSNAISCGTCHNPSLGWSDGQPTSLGHNFKRHRRASPTILNTAYQPAQLWDGRKPTLEDVVLVAMGGAGVMNQPVDKIADKIAAIPGYKPYFEKAYPGEGVTEKTIAKAVASFERTVVSTASPFDRWRQGDASAVSDSAKRGFELFNGKAACVKCHQGFNLTDNGFHNVGVKQAADVPDDGRFEQRKAAVLKGAFKTPTLRDVELTAPYMHNGTLRTLEDVVEHYDRGGDASVANIDPLVKPLGLSAGEKADLVAFMKSLTGPQLRVELPVLPPN